MLTSSPTSALLPQSSGAGPDSEPAIKHNAVSAPGVRSPATNRFDPFTQEHGRITMSFHRVKLESLSRNQIPPPRRASANEWANSARPGRKGSCHA